MASTSISAKKGRNFLLQLGNGTSPESYTTIGGVRATGITINGNPVDITNKSSGGWQELLPGAGVRSVDITGAGIFDASQAGNHAVLEAAALNGGDFVAMRILSEAGDFFTGFWAVATYKRDGNYNDAEMFDITLRSHGVITHAGP